MFCSKCGKELTGDANFCKYCGAKVQREAAVQPGNTALPVLSNNVRADELWEQARTACKENQYEEAITLCARAIRLDPSNWEYRLGRGQVYGIIGKYDRSVPEFTKAIELNPSNAGSYNYRGYAYYMMENYREAISDYNRAIKLDPSVAEFYFDRGVAYMGLEDAERAYKNFKKAKELDPENEEYAKTARKVRKILRENQQAEEEEYRPAPSRPQSQQQASGGNGIADTLLTLGGAFVGGFLTGLLSDNDDD